MTKITLAAYNAGPGRIADCIRLARAQGVDPSTWSNLCSVIPLMSQEADSLAGQDVLYGPFKGKETMAFVKAVLNQYDIFRGLPPRFRMTVDTLETESGDFPPDEDFAEMILMAADSLQRDSLSLESGIVVKEEEKKETPTEQPTGHGQSSKGLSGR